MEATLALVGIFQELRALREVERADDLVSTLLDSRVDGESLTERRVHSSS